MSEHVRIIEVGPRDGLQNEREVLSTFDKLELIERLSLAGLREIEVTSCVSPRRVPQLGDHAELLRRLRRRPGVRYQVLTPNLRGFEAALAEGATEVTVFAAASEAFSQANIQCSVAESMRRFQTIFAAASRAGIRVRGYVSCAIACPYEGPIAPARAAAVAAQLLELGCHEISLGDTTGVGTPLSVSHMLEAVASRVPMNMLAGHFHDTYGMGIANVHACHQLGMRAFDASVAGLGGCPFAKGASGNVATEDLAYLFRGLGVETGIDLGALAACGAWISRKLGRPYASRTGRALACAAQP
jgi:hydroxymethylglutaryl-CoA lyase